MRQTTWTPVYFIAHYAQLFYFIALTKQRFGHVNATNRSSYLAIICTKLVTQV